MTKKILVVDDEPEIVKILQLKLEQDNYRVITAYDGERAVIKARNETPDLVILDIMMPGMDGYQVCEKLKAGEDTKDIPVIMLTAKNMGDDLEKAMEKKADWYVAKPFEYKYLSKKIESILRETENRLVSDKKLLVADDESEILDAIQIYFTRFGFRVAGARDGEEALAKASSEKPDLIILDVMMPKLDGYQVCRKLKENPGTKHIPVVMLTSLAQESDEARGRQSGADAYVTKPFEFSFLQKKIQQLLRAGK